VPSNPAALLHRQLYGVASGLKIQIQVHDHELWISGNIITHLFSKRHGTSPKLVHKVWLSPQDAAEPMLEATSCSFMKQTSNAFTFQHTVYVVFASVSVRRVDGQSLQFRACLRTPMLNEHTRTRKSQLTRNATKINIHISIFATRIQLLPMLQTTCALLCDASPLDFYLLLHKYGQAKHQMKHHIHFIRDSRLVHPCQAQHSLGTSSAPSSGSAPSKKRFRAGHSLKQGHNVLVHWNCST
jgi:hypothetical protein